MNIPIGTPAESAGELYVKTDISPEDFFRAIGRLRKEARDEIFRLIQFLDETDDHMEREQNGDEDEDSDPGEDGGDEEYSLGSLERSPSADGPDGHNPTGSQIAWAIGRGEDLEDEHDGAEPPEDDEPSLGWTSAGVFGGYSDSERDDCDREDNESLLTECA